MFHVLDKGELVMERPPVEVRPYAQLIELDGVEYGALRHDMQTILWLTSLGYTPPTPILTDYSWPRDVVEVEEPFTHQMITADFFVRNTRGYCLNDIGTGKSLSAAWACDFLMSIGAAHRALIVAPLSALERAWADTFFYHFRHRTYNVLHGAASRRLKLLAQPKDFYIINHEGVAVIQKALMERTDIDIVVIDELAVYRNKTDKWKAIDKIISPPGKPVSPRKWVWGMTGTPTPQEPTDAYNQCKLLTPASVPKYFTSFRELCMQHQSTYVWTPRKESTKIVYEAMRPAIRFTRDECLDLPDELYSTKDVEMSAEQKKHYKELTKEFVTEVQGGRVTAVNEGIKQSKLMQIAGGVVYDTTGRGVELDPGNRIETMLEIIEQCNEKVIVFVPFTEMLFRVHREISAHWSCDFVFGDVPKAQRDTIFANFQNKPDPSVLAAHPQCMAHALTLTEASTIIWYAPIDSNDIFTQANGRITRASQKYVANIIMLAGSPVERRAYKRLKARQGMQGMLLDMVAQGEL